MYKNISLEEDLALKNVVVRPRSEKPDFAWREQLGSTPQSVPHIIVTSGEQESELSLADVADTIGGALTDLLLARQAKEDTIFNEENRHFVSGVVSRVADSLMDQVGGGGAQLRLTKSDLYLLIEKALIESDAHDVAKSLVFNRSLADTGNVEMSAMSSEPFTVRLIRRSGNVVPWSETKIENAVRQAFLTIKQDASGASIVAHAVTGRVRDEEKAFVHIEDVQDMVQEELMRAGFFKVAEHYILYRAQRAQNRKLEEAAPTEDPQQESMVVVSTPDGGSIFWDGLELKKRIQFASIGLDLCISDTEIERELRRSIGAEITASDLEKTIVLNAKTLIEQDADFSIFAGRILLSYIYEEVLGWSILDDGIEGLKAAHATKFKAYLKYGVEIKRISPELLDGR